MTEPYLLHFNKIGTEEKGFLVPFEQIPFKIEHVYCIGPVPENETRGKHAKKQNTQILIAIGGRATVYLEAPCGKQFEYQLLDNTYGLLIPAGYWRSAKLEKGCYLLGLHSIKYSEEDYIRDYDEFKKLNNR